jgi:uncharacterized membrane protein
MQETLASTSVGTRRSLILGTFVFAVLETVFGVYLGFRHSGKLMSWMGICLLMSLIGIAVTQIRLYRLSKNEETPVELFGIFVSVNITISFLLIALGWALRS